MITSSDHQQFIGAASLSNFSAEMSAIVWAASWTIGVECPCCIHYDSTGAANTATGEWQSKKHVQLAQVALATVALSGAGRSREFKHVKGHSGNPWNEMADRVADAVISDRTRLQGFRPCASPFFSARLPRAEQHDIRLATALVNGEFLGHQFPPLNGNFLFVGEQNPPQYSVAFPESSKPPLQSGHRRKKCKLSGFVLAMLQVNILTLAHSKDIAGDNVAVKGRVGYLDCEFSAAGLQLIGLQERRTPGPKMRNLPHYWAVAGGSGDGKT